MTTTANKYNYITRGAQLQEYVSRYKQEKLIALDIKTMEDDPLVPGQAKIRLIQLAAPTLPVLIIDWKKIDFLGKKMVKEILESSMLKIVHNAKGAMKCLKAIGINLKLPVFDTYLAEGILNVGVEKEMLGLQAVAKKYLNITLPKEEPQNDWSSHELTTDQLDCIARDVLVLLLLQSKMIVELQANQLVFNAKREFSILPAIVEMELSGLSG